MRFLKKKYDDSVINKVQAYADGLIKKIETVSQEKTDAQAA